MKYVLIILSAYLLLTPNSLFGQTEDIHNIFTKIETLYNEGLYDSAYTLALETEKLAKIQYGEKDTVYAMALNTMGMIETTYGDLNAGFNYLMTAKNIFISNNNTKGIQYSNILVNLTACYIYLGELIEAEKLGLESLQLKEKLFGKEHQEYAIALNNLAIVYNDLGLYKEAELYYKEALKITMKLFGEDHSYVASGMDNLSSMYYDQGRVFEAVELSTKAAEIRKKLFGENHPDYLQSLNSMGILYIEIGREIEAENALYEAINKTAELFGTDNLKMSQKLNNYAQLCAKLKRFKEADSLFLKSIGIVERVHNKQEALLINPLNAYAHSKIKQNKYKEADSILKRVNRIIIQTGREKTADYLFNLHSLIKVNLAAGDMSQSYSYILEAEKLSSQISLYSTNHFYILFYKARYYIQAGDTKNAVHTFKAAFDILRQLIDNSIKYVTESQTIAFYRDLYSSFEVFAAFVIDNMKTHPALTKELFDINSDFTTLLFNSSKKLNRIIEENRDKDVQTKFMQWNSLKKEIYSTLSLSKTELEENSINLDSLIRESEKIELYLRKKVNLIDEDSSYQNNKFESIKKRLKKNEAFLKILRVKYVPTNPDSIIYIGLLITPQTKNYPLGIVIGDGRTLEDKMYGIYKDPKGNDILKNKELYSAYWHPFEKHLKGIKKIILQPDGVYSKINVNTLRNPKTNRYLLDELEVTFVTGNENRKTNGTKTNEKKRAVLFGNPKFSLDLSRKTKLTNEAKRDTLESGESREFYFGGVLEELPGTKIEVETIAEELKSRGWDVELNTGEGAIEEKLKEVTNPNVLHIATHGVFLEENQIITDKKARGVERFIFTDNPLNRSIVFLTGAERTLQNQRSYKDEFEDGVITASEMLSLRLEETELVVLSACETGLGVQKNGEGIYGMQRALHIAGAGYILMSLWEVEDICTQELMTNFYQQWNLTGDIRKGFIEAQKIIKEKYPDPNKWGAFILVGE